jgi:hypothetical protein
VVRLVTGQWKPDATNPPSAKRKGELPKQVERARDENTTFDFRSTYRAEQLCLQILSGGVQGSSLEERGQGDVGLPVARVALVID